MGCGSLFAAMALTSVIACSSGAPVHRAPPILARGGEGLPAGGGGTSGGGGGAPVGSGGAQDPADGAASPCDALASCCAAFDVLDPARDICDQIATEGRPERCGPWLGYLGCGP